MTRELGWIGVDFDGTLAEYHGWKNDGELGPPIPRMLDRVKGWLRDGLDVRIVTARVGLTAVRNIDGQAATMEFAERQEALIKAWCLLHLGKELPVRACKDFMMIELWDDRCVQMIPNTGKTLTEYYEGFRPFPP